MAGIVFDDRYHPRTIQKACCVGCPVPHGRRVLCADRCFHPARVMAAAGTEAALLVHACISAEEIKDAGQWHETKRAPFDWSFERLIQLAVVMGWLPAVQVSEPDDDAVDKLAGEVGDAVRFVQYARNLAAHPGKHAAEMTWLASLGRREYELVYGISRTVLDHLHKLLADDQGSVSAAQLTEGSPVQPPQKQPVLYIIASGGRPAGQLAEFVNFAQDLGWAVSVIGTAGGTKFLDANELAELTNHPVRSQYKQPDEPDVLPPADAFIVAPATFNTINKWAQGMSDTLALGLLNEGIGLGLPMVATPWPNVALARHPVFVRSVATLREWGVSVIIDPDRLPGASDVPPAFPWEELRAELAKLRQAVADRSAT